MRKTKELKLDFFEAIKSIKIKVQTGQLHTQLIIEKMELQLKILVVIWELWKVKSLRVLMIL